ncbi:MAG: hypothetical protein QOD36_675, partial [Mycobacterium sp.]|nr:hypothetical protein [Mycobacterium sp.]
ELRGVDAGVEGRDDLFRIGPVDDADALVAGRKTCFEEGEQDLVALELVGVEAADVIAQRCFDAGDAQIEGIRHGTTPDRQKLLEETSLGASGG